MSFTAPITSNDRTTQLTGSPNVRTGRGIEEQASQETISALSRQNTLNEKENPDGSTTPDSQDGNDTEQERRASIVQGLARQYTQQSTQSVHGNPFTTSDEGSPLNPQSPNFRAKAWAKSIVQMSQEAGHSMRTAGLCYQNLNVFGYGQATDYQKDVANVWLEAANLPRQLLGHGKTKIDILQDFDGVVRNGEMLVVLGPPGSGCSTFLKTVAGETSGLYLNDDSYFNYQGRLHSFPVHEQH